MIKCIVCDLDGTLIKSDDTLEEKTFHTLKGCIDNGIEFIIATGRDINMVVDFLDRYHFNCDLILNNGAQYCNRNQTINEIYPMDNQAFINVASILNDHGYLLAIHTNQGKYSLVDSDEFWDYHMKLLLHSYGSPLPQKTFTTREGYLRDFHYEKEPKDIIDKGLQVLKIDARHLDAYSVKGVKEQLNNDALDISSSYEDNIEITSYLSNKGKLLEKVILEKGYKKDEIAVFGDGENDSYMLKSFHYSFAPKNAGNAAKNAATYNLSLTSEEGAVYEGIEILKDLHLI